MSTCQRMLIGALLALAGATTATPALACGEVMYRMGGALRYQAFVSRHPAHVMLYSHGASARATAAARSDLQRRLEQSGHTVTITEDEASLRQALATQPYDIVITHADNLSLVRSVLDQAPHAAALIPIAAGADSAALRQHYPQVLPADASANRFLKGIERTMQARGS